MTDAPSSYGELIERLGALFAKATPGDWDTRPYPDEWKRDGDVFLTDGKSNLADDIAFDDGAWIAAIKNAWPQIATAIATLTAERDALKDALDDALQRYASAYRLAEAHKAEGQKSYERATAAEEERDRLRGTLQYIADYSSELGIQETARAALSRHRKERV